MFDPLMTARAAHVRQPKYLGDGVYVDFDGFGLTLTTEDGIRVTNTIYLDPVVWRQLESYVATLKSGEDR